MSAQMFNEENGKTFVGYPSSDGNGAYFMPYGICYSISANSSLEKQQCAWDFIRTFATEEWQVENAIPFIEASGNTEAHYSTEVGLCVNNNAFDKIADGLINHEYYSAAFVDKDIEYERHFPTAEDIGRLKAYIDTINLWGTVVDDSLWEIIDEEVMNYLHGEHSLDECIDFIQNRASIWISEQS